MYLMNSKTYFFFKLDFLLHILENYVISAAVFNQLANLRRNLFIDFLELCLKKKSLFHSEIKVKYMMRTVAPLGGFSIYIQISQKVLNCIQFINMDMVLQNVNII